MTGKVFKAIQCIKELADTTFEDGNFDEDGDEALALDIVETYIDTVIDANEVIDDNDETINESETEDDDKEEKE